MLIHVCSERIYWMMGGADCAVYDIIGNEDGADIEEGAGTEGEAVG